jgi:hypothetical protein
MKNKTLIKSKIVLSEYGTGLVIYFWKPTFWIFGYWYALGSSNGADISDIRLNKINDNEVSKVLFDNFL